MQLGAFDRVILVKNVFFRHFPIVFYRKYSKIKRTVFRTCSPWFQGLIFCTEPCLDTLEAWSKGQNGTLSFSLNSFSANDSRVCASDRFISSLCAIIALYSRQMTHVLRPSLPSSLTEVSASFKENCNDGEIYKLVCKFPLLRPISTQ